MEFPNLGEHCSEETCKQLDFLPMKCDACKKIFCKDHFLYSWHRCPESYKKDVQVPICPLCNKPIPVKSGELPDIKVSEHIDRDCKSDPNERKKMIYTNKCYYRKCKQKEIVRVMCPLCQHNYCLKHRHAEDHQCTREQNKPLSKAGVAAVSRLHNNDKTSSAAVKKGTTSSNNVSSEPKIAAIQGSMDEDEAFARALQLSLLDAPPTADQSQDELLARALNQQEQLERQRRSNRQNSTCVLA